MILSLENCCAFDLYRKTLDKTNIDTVDYQKNFTNYYRVRRDAEWLKEFYSYFEKNKNRKDITFEEILRYISNIEHSVKVTESNPSGKAKTVEASFASKMLATINPNHPIWDSQVLRFLNIKTNECQNSSNKIDEYIRIYNEIEIEISNFIKTDCGKECIRIFDETFPNCKDFSDYKKIDFYLWNLGK